MDKDIFNELPEDFDVAMEEEDQVSKLQQLLTQKDNQIKVLEAKIQELEKKLAENSEGIENEADEEVVNQLNQLQLENQQIKEELENLKNENEQLKQQLSQQPEEGIAAEMAVSIEEFEALKQEKQKLEEELMNLKNINQVLTEQLEELKQAQQETGNVEELEKQIKELEEKLATVEMEKKAITQKVIELENEKNNLLEEIDVLKAKLEETVSINLSEEEIKQIVFSIGKVEYPWQEKLLAVIGVTKVDTSGKYNPLTMEVVKYLPVPGVEDQTVVEEIESGFQRAGEVLKKAKVTVARNNIICSSCGKKLPVEAKFCPYCGTKVEEEMIVNEEVFLEVGKALESKRLWDKAALNYKEALTSGINSPEIRARLVECLTKMGKWEEAMEEAKLLDNSFMPLKNKIRAKYQIIKNLEEL